MLVQVKKKAQITLPSKIRERMGISEGDILEVSVHGDRIVLKPRVTRKIVANPVPAREASRMRGLVAVGGDALKDSEGAYD